LGWQQFIRLLNNMNKLTTLFLCCVFLGVFSAKAQREKIQYQTKFDNRTFHWGYYLGLNNKTFKISYTDDDTYINVEPSVGFSVGLIAGWKIHNNITLRLEPGLSSNTKVLTFTNIVGGDRERVREIGATYLHMPLLLKFSTNRLYNFRPYVLGGFSYDYNFSSNEDNPDDNSNGEFRMTSSNFGYELGIGCDFYMPYFIFSPSIRGTFAINNELVYDDDPASPWTGSVDYFGSRGVFISLAFH